MAIAATSIGFAPEREGPIAIADVIPSGMSRDQSREVGRIRPQKNTDARWRNARLQRTYESGWERSGLNLARP